MTAAAGGTILLLSDVHAHYHVVDLQVAHAEARLGAPVSQVLALGDFGLFADNLHRHFRKARRRFRRPVAFIEGNHEDFRAFDRLVHDYADVVTYLPRGSVQAFGERRWLCLGGARYMDSWSTPPGCEVSDEDIRAAMSHAPGSVDIVISHDCPTGIGVPSEGEREHLGPPGVAGFADLAAHLRPRLWVFGHHHRWHRHEAAGTRYIGLPQSWEGYVLVAPDGAVTCVDHLVPLPRNPGWWRWIGLR
ncbi:MAG: metallophosphoesterase [Candidatus Krumholzibacteriia bacterium]